MSKGGANSITIQATINAPVDKVWEMYTNPEHVVKWNHASDDWHSPSARNNLRVGGKFNYRMEVKDGSSGFDFEGVYTNVEELKCIEYVMSDGRKVKITFEDIGENTKVEVVFDPENTNSLEMQRTGWQAILDNFKGYVEKNAF